MADGDAATGRATVLVAAVLGLLSISEADYGAANGGPAEVPFVAALSTLPMPYVLVLPLSLSSRKLCGPTSGFPRLPRRPPRSGSWSSSQ